MKKKKYKIYFTKALCAAKLSDFKAANLAGEIKDLCPQRDQKFRINRALKISQVTKVPR